MANIIAANRYSSHHSGFLARQQLVQLVTLAVMKGTAIILGAAPALLASTQAAPTTNEQSFDPCIAINQTGTVNGASAFNETTILNRTSISSGPTALNLTSRYNGTTALNSTASFNGSAMLNATIFPNGTASWNRTGFWNKTAALGGVTGFNGTAVFNGTTALHGTASFNGTAALNGTAAFNETLAAGAPSDQIPLWRRSSPSPQIATDFPDPSILQDVDGKWYAFATAGNGKHIQAAESSHPRGPWKWLDVDLLPDDGPWTNNMNTWAPDIRRMDDGTYVMYFSGQVKASPAHHCIGTATAKTILGPYTPSKEPFACDVTVGGSIDPAGFQDADGKRYVVYKIDGNSIGRGGLCLNGIAPFVPTPILLQEVGQDGLTKIGDPIQILDREDVDGPLVEAPSLLRTKDGVYVLFFSSGCFTSPTYNVDYAVADSVKGPYTRSPSGPLVRTNDAFGLTAPGGATPVVDGSSIVFHADCPEGRCFFQSNIDVMGKKVVLDGVDGIR